jgi:hypothetical protein
MAQSSWDNDGVVPGKKRLGTGMKVLLGCGVAFLILVTTCMVGGFALSNMIKKDPKAFESRVENWAKGMIQKDWDRLRGLVDQLQTDEGARAVYRSNPDLRQAHPSEEEFLKVVQGWRAQLTPLPVEVPLEVDHRHRRESGAKETRKRHFVTLNKTFGTTHITCRYPDGTHLAVDFKEDRVLRINVD